MKKALCLLLSLCLCACALAGCSREAEEPASDEPIAYTVIQDPATSEGPHGEVDQSALVGSQTAQIYSEGGEETQSPDYSDDEPIDIDALINGGPTTVPYEEPASAGDVAVIDPNTFQFSAATDEALGFTFNYPSQWVNIPGVYTICFREPVDDDSFPARVAVTAKKLVHRPEGSVISDQLTSYMKIIAKQYDSSTFQPGTPNAEDTFMGQVAMSNTYLAFSGDTEIKGFIIGCAVERVMYVFHFCAEYDEYVALETMMRYICRSVQPLSKD